jgi:hypothetical protein
VQHLGGLGASHIPRIGPQEVIQVLPAVHARPAVS